MKIQIKMQTGSNNLSIPNKRIPPIQQTLLLSIYARVKVSTSVTKLSDPVSSVFVCREFSDHKFHSSGQKHLSIFPTLFSLQNFFKQMRKNSTWDQHANDSQYVFFFFVFIIISFIFCFLFKFSQRLLIKIYSRI